MNIRQNESLDIFKEYYEISEGHTFPNNAEINKEVNNIVNYNSLFNSKFKELLNFFYIEDKMGIYQFLKENDNIFSIIDYIKSTLNKHFKGEHFVLRITHDPEIDDNLLNIIIKVNYEKNNIDTLLNKLNNINSEIRPLKRKYNLIGTFLIDVECL